MSSVVNAIKGFVVRNSSESPLFQSVKIGQHELKYRAIYAPLTRCRGIGNIPQPEAAIYYSQRASEGVFMLTEATPVLPEGHGYPNLPGVYTDEQVEAWKPIVKAVKDKGAVFFMQIWHAGRISHPDYQPGNSAPVGPSAHTVTNGQQVFSLSEGKMVDYPVPRALEKSELPSIVEGFVQGAKNAMQAGFDGVEIHGANGYLLDQFLKQSANHRTDEYGGSIENRSRLTLEVVAAVAEAIGSDKVGVRLSPYAFEFHDCTEPDVDSTIALNVYLLKELNKLNLAYAHVVSARTVGTDDAENPDLEKQTLKPFREAFDGPLIAAGGYTKETAEKELIEGNADLITFGRWWLANPDFLERLREDKPLNKYNRDTFYTPDQVVGYTDYPFLKDIPEDTPTEKHYTGVTVFAPTK